MNKEQISKINSISQLKDMLANENNPEIVKTIKKRIKILKTRKSIIWILVILLLLGVAAGYFYYANTTSMDSFGGVREQDVEIQEDIEMDSVPEFIVADITPVYSTVDESSKSIENISDFLRVMKENKESKDIKKTGKLGIPQIAIKFSLASDELDTDSKAFLREYAKSFLSTNQNAVINLEGYTCDIGGEEINMKLSKKRADKVYKELQNNGVAQENIEREWFGYSRNSQFNFKKKEDYRRVNISIQNKE